MSKHPLHSLHVASSAHCQARRCVSQLVGCQPVQTSSSDCRVKHLPSKVAQQQHATFGCRKDEVIESSVSQLLT